MFLLVPAHPGFPGQIPQSRKTVVCVCVCAEPALGVFCHVFCSAIDLLFLTFIPSNNISISSAVFAGLAQTDSHTNHAMTRRVKTFLLKLSFLISYTVGLAKHILNGDFMILRGDGCKIFVWRDASHNINVCLFRSFLVLSQLLFQTNSLVDLSRTQSTTTHHCYD